MSSDPNECLSKVRKGGEKNQEWHELQGKELSASDIIFSIESALTFSSSSFICLMISQEDQNWRPFFDSIKDQIQNVKI